jgi:hypothetical protein
MNIQSERAQQIDLYIQKNYNLSHQEEGRWPIEISGLKVILPFYKFPISLLNYNVNNGRLAMEVRDWEIKNERILNANLENDAAIIRDLLLSLDKIQTDLLEKDLENKGQMEPGVITHDGYVINGNRRMAILEKLHQNTATGKWEYLEAVRLPPTISQKDLWKIEAGLQLSKDKVAEYHPVNELLKIKQGIDAGLKPKEVAAAMYGRTEIEIGEALERLELIDEFLDFFGQHENYGLIKKFGLHEHFIDIQKTILSVGKRKGLPRRERQLNLEMAFALIRASILVQNQLDQSKRRKKGITHWDIREFGKVIEDSNAKGTYKEYLTKNGKTLKDIRSVQPEMVIEGFKAAKEVIENKEDRDKPVLLIEKAIKALESIDRNSEHFHGDRVKKSLDRLLEKARELASSIKVDLPK